MFKIEIYTICDRCQGTGRITPTAYPDKTISCVDCEDGKNYVGDLEDPQWMMRNEKIIVIKGIINLDKL